jgi:hypothetical protein
MEIRQLRLVGSSDFSIPSNTLSNTTNTGNKQSSLRTQFLKLQIALTAFPALTTATAIPSSDLTVETKSNPLAKRSDHEAHFYTELGCPAASTQAHGFQLWRHLPYYEQELGVHLPSVLRKGREAYGVVLHEWRLWGLLAENTGIASGTTSCTAQHDKMYSCYVYHNC